jgi:hypothetical protein
MSLHWWSFGQLSFWLNAILATVTPLVVIWPIVVWLNVILPYVTPLVVIWPIVVRLNVILPIVFAFVG